MRLLLVLLILVTMTGCAKGLVIAVTFPSLKYDVKMIAPKDRIVSIAKPGVDPHTYQLTPHDIELLKRADVIISTAHTPFELKIRDLVRSGEIKAVLIEIPKIPGIRLRRIPGTDMINYHMPIYDPKNYEVFIKYVASVLSRINPKGRYIERANRVCEEVESIVRSCKRLNVTAVADVPPDQYAVEWLGVRVKYVLIRNPGLPVLPKDYERVVESVREGKVGLIVVTNSPGRKFLENLASRYGIPVMFIPSPLSNESFVERFKEIAREKTFIPKESPGFLLPILAIPIALRVMRCCRSS